MGNCFLYKRGFGGGFGGGGSTPEVEKTASGKVIAIHDSMEKPLKGLRLFGNTTQNGTPSPENPVPLVSAGDGGSVGVTVCGKNLIDFSTVTMGYELDNGIGFTGVNAEWYVTDWIQVQPSTTYVLSGMSSAYHAEVNANYEGSTNGRSEYVFTTKADTKYVRFNSKINGYSTPQLEVGSTATAYEPYKEPQTMIHQTPNGLPGIHVSEGGNYTDENGWQWICDEVDFAGGKYIQRVLRIASYNGETIPGAYMSSTGALTTGATVLYALAKSIIHDLSSEELAAYAALHTNYPSTTLYNDADSYMEVKYMAKGG